MRTIFCIIGTMFFSTISNADTFLYFNSQLGDYIGGGKEQSWSTTDGEFTASKNFSNGVIVNFNGGMSWWALNFAAPNNEILKPGPYENAARHPFQSPTQPGLDISGSGRGCNELTGRFDILEIEL